MKSTRVLQWLLGLAAFVGVLLLVSRLLSGDHDAALAVAVGLLLIAYAFVPEYVPILGRSYPSRMVQAKNRH